MRLLFSIFLLIIYAQSSFSLDSRLKLIDESMNETLHRWQVPGLSLVVIEGDNILLCKGYGVTEVNTEEPVTENTLFSIASATKAFTSAALGILVDRSELSWETPVTSYINDLKFHDKETHDHCNLIDLLAHRTGLPNCDATWYLDPDSISRAELMKRMRALKNIKPFRSEYIYHNMLYMIAGEAIPASQNITWDTFIQKEIFDPLEMLSSTTSHTTHNTSYSKASPHSRAGREICAVPHRNFNCIAAAASINSNATDMAAWLQCLINEGSPILSKEQFQMICKAHIKIPFTLERALKYPHLSGFDYALGWHSYTYRNMHILEHQGGLDGMSSLVAFIPETKQGLVILSNLFPSLLNSNLMCQIFDALQGHHDKHWDSIFRQSHDNLLMGFKMYQEVFEGSRYYFTKPSAPIHNYTGTFHDPYYGDVNIYEKDGKLFLKQRLYTTPLTHWHYDTYSFFNLTPVPICTHISFNFKNKDTQAQSFNVKSSYGNFDATFHRKKKSSLNILYIND